MLLKTQVLHVQFPCTHHHPKRGRVKPLPLGLIWSSAGNLVNRSETQGLITKRGCAIHLLMGLAAIARCATAISLLGSLQGFRPETPCPGAISTTCLGPSGVSLMLGGSAQNWTLTKWGGMKRVFFFFDALIFMFVGLFNRLSTKYIWCL